MLLLMLVGWLVGKSGDSEVLGRSQVRFGGTELRNRRAG